MNLPKIKKYSAKQLDLDLPKIKYSYSTDEFGNLCIRDLEGGREISAKLSDWFKYAFWSLTPASAEKLTSIIFDYDPKEECEEKSIKQKEISEESFFPTMFRIRHRESGLFSSKGNHSITVHKSLKNGIAKWSGYGWSKRGSIWNIKTFAFQHIKSMVIRDMGLHSFKTGVEYFEKRDLLLSGYDLVCSDDEGNTKQYPLDKVTPRSEIEPRWSDAKFWKQSHSEEEKKRKAIESRRKRLKSKNDRSEKPE